MTSHHGVKGMTLLNYTIGLSIAASISAGSLYWLPSLLDNADRNVADYALQASRMNTLINQQYLQASGHTDTLLPGILYHGLTEKNGHRYSPLGHYCFADQVSNASLKPCKPQ